MLTASAKSVILLCLFGLMQGTQSALATSAPMNKSLFCILMRKISQVLTSRNESLQLGLKGQEKCFFKGMSDRGKGSTAPSLALRPMDSSYCIHSTLMPATSSSEVHGPVVAALSWRLR